MRTLLSPPRSSSVVLELPSTGRRADYLAAARRSRAFLRRNARTPLTPAAYDRWLADAVTDTRQRMFICRREGGELIGVATLSEIVRGAFNSAYLGYHRFEPWGGRGYMSAGIDLVLREAFQGLKLHRVEANIEPHNTPSRALVQRLGFRLEGLSRRYLRIAGRWRDHERWAILAEEWRARRRARGPG